MRNRDFACALARAMLGSEKNTLLHHLFFFLQVRKISRQLSACLNYDAADREDLTQHHKNDRVGQSQAPIPNHGIADRQSSTFELFHVLHGVPVAAHCDACKKALIIGT